MATDKNLLKDWFRTGKKPTQAQFWAWLESYYHKDEKIPQSSINGLETALNNKAETSQLTGHINDPNAHGLADKFEGKSDVGHTHAISEVDGLAGELQGIISDINGKSDAVHTHVISDIDGLGLELETIKGDIETNHNTAIQKSTTYTPIHNLISLTQVEYDAIEVKDAATIYFIQ